MYESQTPMNNMKIIKIIGCVACTFTLMCMTGFDCPETNFKAQIAATLISLSVAVICGLIVAKNGQR